MPEVKTNARVGKIRPRRTFPLYISRPVFGPGFCGHQHSLKASAVGCAENQEHRTRQRWDVIRVNKDGRETTVD